MVASIAAAAAAERVLRLVTSSKYRKGSLEQMAFPECRDGFLQGLHRRTRAGAPVQLTLMAFPFKVPNPAKVASRALPDLAEFAALRWCRAMAAAVAEVYAPGLRLEVIHDGALIGEVFGLDLQAVRAYEEYFANLVRLSGAEQVVRCHDFSALQQQAGLDPTNSLSALQDEALEWWRSSRGTLEWRACFRKTCGMLHLREFSPEAATEILQASEGGSLAPEYTCLEQRVHAAMIAYRVKNAVIHRFDPRPILFPDAIHVTTRVQPGRLALWLVRRGRSLLPWHGVGLVDESRRARVAFAKDVAFCANLRPVLLRGEDTPFCYAPTGADFDVHTLLRS